MTHLYHLVIHKDDEHVFLKVYWLEEVREIQYHVLPRLLLYDFLHLQNLQINGFILTKVINITLYLQWSINLPLRSENSRSSIEWSYLLSSISGSVILVLVICYKINYQELKKYFLKKFTTSSQNAWLEIEITKFV